jgi:dihydropteroate synthase
MIRPFHCGRYVLEAGRPLIMGIVNLTDDSFSGDGLADDAKRGIESALRQVEYGADIIDLGAESSRPGAKTIPAEQELSRLIPVIKAIRECGVPISVDTTKPKVMEAVLGAGVDMINDIRALSEPGALEVIKQSSAAVCLMHMQGTPDTMQNAPHYDDVVEEVLRFLARRADQLVSAGIDRQRICIDPGFGFGKSLAHNIELLRNLSTFADLDLPVLVGMSRKSMLGMITGRAVEAREPAGIAAHVLAVLGGAGILRVHDVATTRDALAVVAAFNGWVKI